VQLYVDIDKIVDPMPDKEKPMKNRKDGPVLKDAEPPNARLLKNRIRKWQVRPELLEANPHWLGSRIAENGVAWGDVTDPVDEPKHARNGSEVPT
jgi:hypothetical protein